MTRRLTALLTAGLLLVSVGTANAYTNWVNDFTTAFIRLHQSGSTGYGSLATFWENNNGNATNYNWEIAGAQYIGARANVKERIETDLREVYDFDCVTATIEVARWRDTTPPTTNSTCNSGSTSGNTYLGTVTYTISSCGNGYADDTFSHRNQPVFDFSSEGSAPVGATWGYISRVRATTVRDSTGEITGLEKFMCYRLWWFAQ